MKKLMALTLAVALVGAGSALARSSTLHLTAKKSAWAFNTKTLSARSGTVTIKMTNPSSTSHGIAIEGHGVDKDGKIVGKGKTSSVTVKLKPGKYTFYCPVPGHKEAGMKGTLVVK
jgi:plastocyanin